MVSYFQDGADAAASSGCPPSAFDIIDSLYVLVPIHSTFTQNFIHHEMAEQQICTNEVNNNKNSNIKLLYG